ncbi:hypothetical protein [Lysinibacillus sp. BW-2-10]|uniref:hypothetical protein n=1 Tax=Lysinibacillus sp. BW-2-10 TaxID=2590030 RepID=UPI00117D6D58|nr:hypothetical protein [Lysinibacillus sp. BW-2-10]TSI11029.1 hypothetical protein FJQ64_02315 [Lysinibacillus sp. BW-2-10]
MEKLLLFLSIVTALFLVGCSSLIPKEDTTPVVKEEQTSKTEETSKTNEGSSIGNNVGDTTKEESPPKAEPATSNNDEDLAQAFSDYLDEVVLLAPEEDRLIGLYDSVTGANYQNDEIMYYTLLDDIVPGYRQFVVDLEAIMPSHPDVRAIHETYIDAANIQYNAFVLMLSALEEQDRNTMAEANQGLDEARQLIRDWLYGIEDLSAKTGIALE